MSKIAVTELKKGMIISSDIFSKKGSLLLYKGFKIENPELVAVVLGRNDIEMVDIKDGAETSSVVSEKVKESNDVSEKIFQEVVEFKDEFNGVIKNISKDVETFNETKDIKDIKSLDQGSKIAQNNDKSILTLFQLVEKIKNERSSKYTDLLQISLLSYAIGKWMQFNETELKDLSEAALLHGMFTEYSITVDNIDQVKGTENVSDITLKSALYASERNDGSGPLGLKGDEIPSYSKIIAIAQVFYRLTMPNDLSEKLSVFDAIKIMQTEYMPVLDAKFLYIFLHRVSSKYMGSTVRLSNGKSGIIVFVPENEIAFPYIKTDDGEVINLQSSENRNTKIIEII